MERKTSCSSCLLRRAHIANAAFSTLSALTGLFAAGTVARMMGLESTLPIYLVAPGLLLFAFFLIRNARAPRVDLLQASLFTIGDALWVIATGVLLVSWPNVVNQDGQMILIGIAFFVGLFGLLQAMGIAKIKRSPLGDACVPST